MIVEKRISFRRLLRIVWRELLVIAAVSALPVVALIELDLGDYAINTSIPLVIGTAIAIFLGFRTNSAYERWWEARKLWGGMISDSRNLVRFSKQFLLAHDDQDAVESAHLIRICHRQIAWAWLVDHQLKDLPIPDRIEHWLSKEDFDRIQDSHNPCLLLLDWHSQSMRDATTRKRINERQWILVEETLSRLTDFYGGCQRIKTTVFPTHYTFFTRVFIWIFIALLAFSLPAHENANYSLIPAIFLIGWVFLMVEGIGSYMQDPFALNRNVIPMDSLARVIERDLLATVGQSDLPEPIEPIDGALY